MWMTMADLVLHFVPSRLLPRSTSAGPFHAVRPTSLPLIVGICFQALTIAGSLGTDSPNGTRHRCGETTFRMSRRRIHRHAVHTMPCDSTCEDVVLRKELVRLLSGDVRAGTSYNAGHPSINVGY